MSFKPSKYQLDVFDAYKNTSSNLLIQAGPGSGKTTTLLEVLKFVTPDKKVIFLAFNKSIVEELKTKVSYNIQVSTIHSLGAKSIFRYYNGRVKVDENKTFGFGLKLADKWGLWGRNKFSYIGTVSQLVNIYKLYLCKGLDQLRELAERYDIISINGEIERAIELMDYLDCYNKKPVEEDDNKVIDFSDMIYLPVTDDNFQFSSYDEVFVDECQDLNVLQQKIVRKILKSDGRFIGVGDNRQCIYSFLGADPESFDNFKEESNTVSLPLSICYRCGKKIVEKANTIFIEEQIESPVDVWEGEVKSDSYKSVKEGDFILCRNNQPLVELYLELLKEGKACYIKGKDIGKSLMALVEKIQTYDRWEGLDYLQEQADNIKQELRRKGVVNVENHPRYRSFLEKITIIGILVREFDDFASVKNKLEKMFVNNISKGIILSTIHKIKGLEADNVYILKWNLLPSSYATQEWEFRQEKNLQYVAITRARKKLVFINDF